MQRAFHLGNKVFEEYRNKSKKPQIRVLDNPAFTLVLDIKFSDAQTLVAEGAYLLFGEGWFVTIHSPRVDLASTVSRLLEEKTC